MTQIIYEDFPQDKLERIKAMMSPLDRMIPAWCRTVYVYHRPTFPEGNDSVIAATDVSPDYLVTALKIYPMFWDESNRDRQMRDLTHEIVHIITARLAQCPEHILNAVYPADKERGPAYVFMRRSLDEAREATVEELAFLLLDLIQERTAP